MSSSDVDEEEEKSSNTSRSSAQEDSIQNFCSYLLTCGYNDIKLIVDVSIQIQFFQYFFLYWFKTNFYFVFWKNTDSKIYKVKQGKGVAAIKIGERSRIDKEYAALKILQGEISPKQFNFC